MQLVYELTSENATHGYRFIFTSDNCYVSEIKLDTGVEERTKNLTEESINYRIIKNKNINPNPNKRETKRDKSIMPEIVRIWQYIVERLCNPQMDIKKDFSLTEIEKQTSTSHYFTKESIVKDFMNQSPYTDNRYSSYFICGYRAKPEVKCTIADDPRLLVKLYSRNMIDKQSGKTIVIDNILEYEKIFFNEIHNNHTIALIGKRNSGKSYILNAMANSLFKDSHVKCKVHCADLYTIATSELFLNDIAVEKDTEINPERSFILKYFELDELIEGYKYAFFLDNIDSLYKNSEIAHKAYRIKQELLKLSKASNIILFVTCSDIDYCSYLYNVSNYILGDIVLSNEEKQKYSSFTEVMINPTYYTILTEYNDIESKDPFDVLEYAQNIILKNYLVRISGTKNPSYELLYLNYLLLPEIAVYMDEHDKDYILDNEIIELFHYKFSSGNNCAIYNECLYYGLSLNNKTTKELNYKRLSNIPGFRPDKTYVEYLNMIKYNSDLIENINNGIKFKSDLVKSYFAAQHVVEYIKAFSSGLIPLKISEMPIYNVSRRTRDFINRKLFSFIDTKELTGKETDYIKQTLIIRKFFKSPSTINLPLLNIEPENGYVYPDYMNKYDNIEIQKQLQKQIYNLYTLFLFYIHLHYIAEDIMFEYIDILLSDLTNNKDFYSEYNCFFEPEQCDALIQLFFFASEYCIKRNEDKHIHYLPFIEECLLNKCSSSLKKRFNHFMA